jgi:hypothetical protein
MCISALTKGSERSRRAKGREIESRKCRESDERHERNVASIKKMRESGITEAPPAAKAPPAMLRMPV